MTAVLPRPQPLLIAGPAGGLETLLEVPEEAAAPEYAVICHPHPLHGGTLHNKVVHTLARSFQALGLPTLRFNYRGVGTSAGAYDHGRGETDDALAVIEWGAHRWPGAAVSLAGFSFGALVAMRAAPRVGATRLVCVAPPVARPEAAALGPPGCPWLIIQGDADELVDYRQVSAFAARSSPAPTLQVLAGVDHFFHGRLRELQTTVLDFVRPPAP